MIAGFTIMYLIQVAGASVICYLDDDYHAKYLLPVAGFYFMLFD